MTYHQLKGDQKIRGRTTIKVKHRDQQPPPDYFTWEDFISDDDTDDDNQTSNQLFDAFPNLVSIIRYYGTSLIS
jgi:hypothetical protein